MDLEKKEIYPRKTEVNVTHFRSTRVCRSLSTIDLTKKRFNSWRDKWTWHTLIDVSLKIIDEDESRNDRFIREDRSKFNSLSIAESVEIVVERGSSKDRYLLEETEMWILLTLHRQDCPNHLASGFRKNRDSVKGERSKFQLLTIDKIGQNIADH